ncbi:hypothetical protein DY218_15670 [Streptomyces triticagri]|uniref:Uncharacterized protein n=1 Tax=Streptomyces triticagri TaxID=2293568 RepID=A0A372M477_9ACTN|nr:hypothetical protein [Streptomyces triticagri]RFU85748.1 hypothetical protein DY218_15670 [Streptomyces triticagri]
MPQQGAHEPDANPGPTPDPATPDEEPAPGEHRATTVEQGRFCAARCSCGWRGPARRARSKARSDATVHLENPLGA